MDPTIEKIKLVDPMDMVVHLDNRKIDVVFKEHQKVSNLERLVDPFVALTMVMVVDSSDKDSNVRKM